MRVVADTEEEARAAWLEQTRVRDALVGFGVEPDRYGTHIYCRTTATLVERAAGLTLASHLLGHANEQITRASYVVSVEEVDPLTVEILDERLVS